MPILLICTVNFISFTGVQAARIIISLYALNLGATPSGVGGILSMLYVFPLLLSWPVGALSDRIGPRLILAIGMAGTTVGLVLPYFLHNLAVLYVSAALVGLTIAINSVIGQNIVGVLSTPANRAKNFSNYSLSGSLCTLFGPLLIGLSIDHLGYSVSFLAIAANFLLAIGLVIVWGNIFPRAKRQATSKAKLLTTLADRRLWRMLAISSLSQVGNDMFQAFLPVYAHSISLSASAIGTILATCAVGTFGIRLALLPLIKRVGEARLLAFTFYLGAAAYVLVPLFENTMILAARQK
jgi:MFS family permease